MIVYLDLKFTFCLTFLTRILVECVQKNESLSHLSHPIKSNNISTGRLRDILWINVTYIAEDLGLNVTFLCQPFLQKNNNSFHHDLWNDLSLSVVNDSVIIENESFLVRIESNDSKHILSIDDSHIVSKLGLNETLLDYYESIYLNLPQICKLTPRIFWINESTSAKDYNLNTSIICIGYGKSDETKINSTILQEFLNEPNGTLNGTHTENKTVSTNNKKIKNQILKHFETNETSNNFHFNVSEHSPILFIRTTEGLSKLNLNPNLLNKHQAVGIYLPGACTTLKKKIVQAFNASEQFGLNVTQNIGLNVDTLKANLTDLEETLNNDTAVENILTSANDSNQRAYGDSYLLPILNEQSYDAFTTPAVFENQTVQVKVGIYIESISNFQSNTMDYELDIYLRMAWRDPRLIHDLSQPIMCHSKEVLKKIWRPDPYFSNSKEASFHELTFLNFITKIFKNGEMLSENRIKLKPSCNLILCKFPHDIQMCHLFIKSFAYPVDTVKFMWFANAQDAVSQNPAISLPELNIFEHSTSECDGSRVTGNFSCLKVTFLLKREFGFYLAQVYVPTTLALMFSWVTVWIPSDLMEARIGVPLTVLLTLTADSSATSENLPQVSYMKALDIWYNFVFCFVFVTMIETITVLVLDQKHDDLHTEANKLAVKSSMANVLMIKSKKLDVIKENVKTMNAKAEHYHNVRVFLDLLSRYLYPFAFMCFIMYYCFVLIPGPQNSCIPTH